MKGPKWATKTNTNFGNLTETSRGPVGSAALERGGRQHGDTQQIPVTQSMRVFDQHDTYDQSFATDVNYDDEFYAQPKTRRRTLAEVFTSRQHRRSVADPYRARIGALCAIGLLAVPVALAIRDTGSKSIQLAAATIPSTTPPATVAPAAAVVIPNPTVAVLPTAVALAVPVVDPAAAVVTAPVAVAVVPAVEVVAAVITAPPTPAAVVPVLSALPVAAAGPVEVAPVVAQTTTATIVIAPPTTAKPAAVDVSKCAKTYAVIAGDYWIRIAKKISVSLDDLLGVNNAGTDTPLWPGTTICAPANASPPTTAAPAPASTQAPATTAKPPTTTQPPATTAKPPSTTQPPATTQPSPRNTYTTAQVQQIIRDVWPDDQEEEAIRIAWRESNHNPTVKNYCCYGLFQIYYSVHKSWLNAMGISSADMLYDPRTNALAAYALYQRAGGWGPWSL